MDKNLRIFKLTFSPHQKQSLIFILIFGFISLLADITYEGARSITGAYLGVLGASATMVGFIAGFGELLGYSLRFVSGYLIDRTKRYWTITIIGYVINLLAVPLLALTDHWLSAAIFIIAERVGKAIRVPGRDAMLSHAAQSVGMGLGFGIHEALDQFGAMLGPLVVAAVLYYHGSYQIAFAVLGIPAVFALFVLVLARLQYPNPTHLEQQSAHFDTEGLKKIFWIYLLGSCFVGAGFADFALIAYHFQKTNLLSPVWIPISYALAMGINSLFSPLLGHLYDRKGFIILIIVTIIAALFAPLVFLGGKILCFIGVALWSIGISTQQSLMRAIVGNMTPKDKRASAYGIFNMSYGISWFLGSVLMGMIYDYSILWLVIFIMVLQLISLPWFFIVIKKLYSK